MRRREFITLVGGAAAWPLAGRAQQPPVPMIGVLGAVSAGEAADRFGEFRKGLQENGFTEGKNITIEYRWAEGHLERLPLLVMDLVRSQVAVIFTNGGNVPALVAKGATAIIPIVFSTAVDPVRSGLVTNLNRPDRNATGATLVAGSLGTKLIGLLRELAPNARKIGILINPNSPDAVLEAADVQAAVQAIGEHISVLEATNSEEIDKAFATLGQLKLDGLLVNPDPVFLPRRSQIVALAARYAVPTIYYAREYVAAGGLMSYGGSFLWVYRQCGIYVARILKGEKPANLPVMQPT
ncbi:MAG TPA: ABC transporter substrate-binding protein, partial [Pseudolabrys sp.]|nr:ABC transporter substrate-binding protein [Pseudolabrys sp.]